MRFFSLLATAGAAGLALAAPRRIVRRAAADLTQPAQPVQPADGTKSGDGTVQSAPPPKTGNKLRWGVGVNEAGPEFGEGNIPGVKNKDYVWPDPASMQPAIDLGMKIFRVNILMERLVPQLTGTPDPTYLADLKSTVNFLTGAGIVTVISAHNYGRFNHHVISDVPGFKAWWKTVATEFKDNKLVMFDTNNEYMNMAQTLVVSLNQAAIEGIREAGATEQYITVEGNAWSGAWSWTTTSENGKTMSHFNDPAHPGDSSKIIYQMHQYLDGDASGNGDQCVSSTIMVERLAAATAWLRANRKQGLIGEFAGGNNPICIAAVRGGLQYMNQNSDVWLAAIWWAKGPWWHASKFYDFEAPNGPGWKTYAPVLKEFL